MTSVNRTIRRGAGGTTERSRHAPLDSYLVSRRHRSAEGFAADSRLLLDLPKARGRAARPVARFLKSQSCYAGRS